LLSFLFYYVFFHFPALFSLVFNMSCTIFLNLTVVERKPFQIYFFFQFLTLTTLGTPMTSWSLIALKIRKRCILTPTRMVVYLFQLRTFHLIKRNLMHISTSTFSCETFLNKWRFNIIYQNRYSEFESCFCHSTFTSITITRVELHLLKERLSLYVNVRI